MYEKNSSFGLSSNSYINGIVYLYTNKLNNKVYVGQTIDEVNRRSSHKTSKSEDPFHTAIRQDGWDNFDYKVIFRTNVKVVNKFPKPIDNWRTAFRKMRYILNAVETYFINKFDSTNPLKGYNVSPGGSGIGTIGEEIVQLSLEGDLIAEYSSSCDAARRCGIEDISSDTISHRVSMAKTPSKGKGIIEKGFAWLKKIDYINNVVDFPITIPKRMSMGQAKPVLQLDRKTREILQEFQCAEDAAEYLGLSSASPIRDCCSGRFRQFHGFDWMWKEDFISGKGKKNPPKPYKYNFNRPIVQLNLDYSFVCKHNSPSDAWRFINNSTGTSSKTRGGNTHISKSARTKGETTYLEFRFMWEDDYLTNPPEILDLPILQRFSESGELLAEYKTLHEAYEDLNLTMREACFRANISKAVKEDLIRFNSKWKYKQ